MSIKHLIPILIISFTWINNNFIWDAYKHVKDIKIAKEIPITQQLSIKLELKPIHSTNPLNLNPDYQLMSGITYKF